MKPGPKLLSIKQLRDHVKSLGGTLQVTPDEYIVRFGKEHSYYTNSREDAYSTATRMKEERLRLGQDVR